ncbi:hypothetical protein Q4596_06370 [Pseudoalteromonas carrageenovora]|uniref:hypothetical protein n=1 Tax=Pseudoalteromonas carrageenovora TaxID=227 RepID=UPI0026E27C85|nr:hypothetical protein [Pseudoalteromonas carrageenovora]MDO6835240.1 hypothetical protein [Pseudoalteromonas carrageenovora]
MIYIEGGSLWSLCKNDSDYFIQQLSGSMHSETTATYKLTKQVVNDYLSQGDESLSETINFFRNVGNYSARSNERYTHKEASTEIWESIKNR